MMTKKEVNQLRQELKDKVDLLVYLSDTKLTYNINVFKKMKVTDKEFFDKLEIMVDEFKVTDPKTKAKIDALTKEYSAKLREDV